MENTETSDESIDKSIKSLKISILKIETLKSKFFYFFNSIGIAIILTLIIFRKYDFAFVSFILLTSDFDEYLKKIKNEA